MEIKINKEIRAYRETLFFGLSMRQFCMFRFGGGRCCDAVFQLEPRAES